MHLKEAIVFDEAGDYEWTVPDGVTKIIVSAAAGGGESFLKRKFSVTPGATLYLTVGAGGLGGAKGSATAIADVSNLFGQ